MHRLTAETRSAVDTYWATFFGCAPDALHRSDSHVVSHAGLGDYAGVYAMTFEGGAPIVSVPPAYLDLAAAGAVSWSSQSVSSPADLQTLLGPRAGDVIGPAVVSYLDAPPNDRPPADGDVRVLRPSESAHRIAVERLGVACTPTDWAHGGATLTDTPAAGVFHDASLVAMASYTVWGGRLAHIAVVTHPSFRGRGFGRTAVARLLAELDHHLIPQYRTLASNVPALHVATSLGFVSYARSMAVRLRDVDT